MLDKIIKKIIKVFSLVVVSILLLLVLATVVLQLPSVQDSAVNKALQWLGDELGTVVTYKKVRIPSWNRIFFTDFFVADNHGDTLVFAEKATITTPTFFNFLFRTEPDMAILRKIELNKAVLNFVTDSANILNFQYLIDYANSGDSTETEASKPFRIKKIKITDSRYNMLNYTSEPDSGGVSFSNLHLTRFQLEVSNLEVFNGIISMDIDPLTFIDHSGFEVQEFSTHMELSSTHMRFTDTRACTPDSRLDAPEILFLYDRYSDFSPPALYTRVNMSGTFNPSSINFNDIGYFTDIFRDYHQQISISGHFGGPLASFKGKNLEVEWGRDSHLSGNFNITGLPNATETFLIFDLDELHTQSADINSLTLPGNQSVQLPQSLKNITQISYQGNFTGFLNDFVAHGYLTTNLGEVSTDVMIRPDSLGNTLLSGRVGTQNFDLGSLLENEWFHTISIDAGIEAVFSENEPINARIEGKVFRFDLKGYSYQNIQVNGRLSDRLFNGTLSVNDPNLVMDFDGLIDMASELRTYDFNLDVIDANLHALNIAPADSNFHASFLLQANATGKSIDDLNGDFHLLNSLFTRSDQQIQIYDLHVSTRNTPAGNSLDVSSDLLNASMGGHYRLSELKPKLQNTLHRYLPNWILPDTSTTRFTQDTRLDFTLRLNRAQSFFEFFFPQYLFAENSVLKGHFYPAEAASLSLTLTTPALKIEDNNWDGLVVSLSGNDSVLQASLGCELFRWNDQLSFDNFTFDAEVQKGIVQFTSHWMNWDSVLYKGHLDGQAILGLKGGQTALNLRLKPTELTISDSVWQVSAFELNMDTAGIAIRDFALSKNGQSVSANGVLSDTPGDTLNFTFEQFDLKNLNLITEKADMEFAGILSGTGKMTGRNINPLFFASLTVTDMEMNREAFGNFYINSLWNNRKQSLSIDAQATRGQLTMLRIAGDYFPAKNGRMDFDIELNHLKTNIFNPFMEGIFSDIRGYASGELKLSGVRGKPNLSGELFLQKNAFTVDYLKTRYNFTSRIEIANNNVLFHNLEVYDSEGHTGVVNGMIRTDYLRSLSLNMGISLNNLLCMDTKAVDNSYFYGTAYATGKVQIKGDPATLHFNIEAETNSNTRMYIPLSESAEVSEYNYIQFVRHDTNTGNMQADETQQKVNLEGIQMDFKLNVTPDAEVQIIFDPTIGDIIKARGSGNINMAINTLGSFEMLGEYNIEEGDYLFTLRNIINKKFKIEEGSTVQWTGDPLNASIDITTVYRTKALLPSFSSQKESTIETTSVEGEAISNKQNRTTVDCQLFLTGKLKSPDIRYDIQLPLAEEETRERLKSLIQTEENLSMQFLFLMVMNQFYEGGENSSGNIASSNAGELLSNQFSNWLSQISNDFDLGFTYRPGDDLSNSEVELALSTQLFNDRLSIDGSVDMKSETAQQNASGFVGDFDLDYKLNEKGKIRLHAYNRSNDNTLELSAPYTQGFGIFFKEEFNSLGELGERYWAILSGKKRKAKKPDGAAKM